MRSYSYFLNEDFAYNHLSLPSASPLTSKSWEARYSHSKAAKLQNLIWLNIVVSLLQGGAFYFLEHVVSDPSSWTYFFQHVFEPLWYYLGDGCMVTRSTWKDLEAAGFSELHLRHVEAPDVTLMIRPHIMGYSIKWLPGGMGRLYCASCTAVNLYIFLSTEQKFTNTHTAFIEWKYIYLLTESATFYTPFVLLPHPSQDVHNKYYLDTVLFFPDCLSNCQETTKQTSLNVVISVTLYIPLHKNKEWQL